MGLAGRAARPARAAWRRWRRAGPTSVAWAVRLTGAAVASYLAALAVLPGTAPLLAPLTALLVVQLTPVSLLAAGLDRVAAVVAGVVVAVSFAAVVGLSWWSLGLVVLVSILVGQALRLRNNLVEVAISAMLVLGAGSFGTAPAALDRVGETLVGAAVGVAITLALPPRIATADARAELVRLADRLADLLEDSAATLAREDPTASLEAAPQWLGRARQINHDVPPAGAAVLRAEEGRRLNLRALAVADTGPGLRQGLESLEHSAVAVRSMYRTLLDARDATAWREGEVGTLVRGAVASALEDQGAALRAFGALVATEARRRPVTGELADLAGALEGLREAEARLTDLALVDHEGSAEPTATLLSTVRRLLVDLDPGRRGQALAGHHPHGLTAVVERRRERLERAMLAAPPLGRRGARVEGRARPRHAASR